MPQAKMIKIPEEAQGEIFLLARRAKWSKDRIGQACAHVLTSCEMLRREADANLWTALRRICPEAKTLSNPAYDADSGRVMERNAKGEPTGKAIEVPRGCLGEIALLLDDLDCAAGACKLVAVMAVNMEEHAEDASERLRMSIGRHIPETTDGGTWEIDDMRMVVIRHPDPKPGQEGPNFPLVPEGTGHCHPDPDGPHFPLVPEGTGHCHQ